MAALREAATRARKAKDNTQDFTSLPLPCPVCPDAPDMVPLASVQDKAPAEIENALR